jgi:putative hydrolase of the HAD superfamily
MKPVRAVIFDLGGTLIDWPDWDDDIERRWGLSYDYLVTTLPGNHWPDSATYVRAMREAEKYHWQQVAKCQASSTPTALVRDGFQRMGLSVNEQELLTAIDGYARAVNGWAIVFPDTQQTLQTLRKQGYRLGLLSNTWWAAEWHNAELATHGLGNLFDVIAYTSDLPRSKPHPSVFHYVAKRLGLPPEECIMVGDRMVDDIGGALAAGMRAVWRQNDYPWPKPDTITPTAVINNLADLLPLLRAWDKSSAPPY